MAVLRLCFLWHMHQPFYKDLATGEYRLPWVRLHSLKDYYGMVKLLDEFPTVQQTFNVVPSLLLQIQDYASGTAKDAFYDVIAKPATDLSEAERIFALKYLFQANTRQLIGRYPRYAALLHDLHAAGSEEHAAKRWSNQQFADLQVLSQLAWFDEFWIDNDADVAALIAKGKNFNRDDQQIMLGKQHEILNAVIPAYRAAAEKRSIEISTTPFYHPILPLLCDTNIGKVSAPEIPLPRSRFRHPEDAQEQMHRALDFCEQTFGQRPRGMWPSEGSVSNEVLAMASKMGVQWMATDEGVLSRSLDSWLARDQHGTLSADSADRLYRAYRVGEDDDQIGMVFRDHSLSDLIGFVYAGMDAQAAVEHFMRQLKASAAPVLASGRDAVVSVILDGENAWEHFPRSGREFLRRLYSAFADDPEIKAQSIGTALQQVNAKQVARIPSVVPGSWINANFNVWIGAAEDNLSWDYLSSARAFFEAHAASATPEQRQLAHEELLIAEGSDWNWWYGPEHSTANDADFDRLYRKHLANIYRALGHEPASHLSQPIAGSQSGPKVTPQTQFIRPRMSGNAVSYFDWLGAASYTGSAQGAMHGGSHLLRDIYAGFDERYLYARLDFTAKPPENAGIVLEVESLSERNERLALSHFRISIVNSRVKRFILLRDSQLDTQPSLNAGEFEEARVRLTRVLELRLQQAAVGAVKEGRLRLCFSLVQNGVTIETIPREGSMTLPVLNEEELQELAQKHW